MKLVMMASVLLLFTYAFYPTQAHAQDPKPLLGFAEIGGHEYTIRVRVGNAFVFEARVSSTGDSGDENKLGYQWYVVQDSSIGLVFRDPSGFKVYAGEFNGDIDVVTLSDIDAVEFGRRGQADNRPVVATVPATAGQPSRRPAHLVVEQHGVRS